ncbi:hypothetical protein PoB_000767600, partial [Plakobranchus ocellatus]
TSVRNCSNHIYIGPAVTAIWDLSGTVDSESALRFAGTILSWIRAPPLAPWPDGGFEKIASPCSGLAIYKN